MCEALSVMHENLITDLVKKQKHHVTSRVTMYKRPSAGTAKGENTSKTTKQRSTINDYPLS